MDSVLLLIKRTRNIRYVLPIVGLVIMILSVSVILGTHSEKEEVKGITIVPTIHPTPTEMPTNTPIPSTPIHSKTIHSANLRPVNGVGNTPVPTQVMQTSANGSINNGVPTPTITQKLNPVPSQVVNSAPIVATDCSSISGTIAGIKNTYQPEIDSMTSSTNAELGRRGITSDSELGQQQLQAALQPIYAQENAQVAQYCIAAIHNGCSCP